MVSQRLKRWEPLTSKLLTQQTLTLSRMQDLAGCRAALEDMAEIDRVRKRLEKIRPVLDVFSVTSEVIASALAVSCGPTGTPQHLSGRINR